MPFSTIPASSGFLLCMLEFERTDGSRMDLTATIAAQRVLRPLCLLRMAAAHAPVGPAEVTTGQPTRADVLAGPGKQATPRGGVCSRARRLDVRGELREARRSEPTRWAWLDDAAAP